jgi:Tfp pilus assembly protein PilZ
MRERGAVRLIPRHPVPVEIMTVGVAAARGLLANISEHGACVWTETAFDEGEALVLRLGFKGEKQPFQVAGEVVWSDRMGHTASRGRCGVRWAFPEGPRYERLKVLIRGC